MAPAAGCATGDQEGPEAADGNRAAAAQAVADAGEEGVQGERGGTLGVAGASGEDGDEVGAVHDDAVMTRATASSNTDGGKGFSMTGAPESSRKAQASGLAVSPVMNTKRRASAGVWASTRL